VPEVRTAGFTKIAPVASGTQQLNGPLQARGQCSVLVSWSSSVVSLKVLAAHRVLAALLASRDSGSNPQPHHQPVIALGSAESDALPVTLNYHFSGCVQASVVVEVAPTPCLFFRRVDLRKFEVPDVLRIERKQEVGPVSADT
jgi:hypothetical protein